ncbi:MAG TPA: hypothetical protein VKJ00_14685, partial [Thermoanaerobaculia bacterium]|nr:hypothetical protein [Thermoanaerobaculia bacterium]
VFIWGDGTTNFISTTTPNQFLVLATGGFGINTTTPAAALDVAGTIRSSTGGFKFPDNSTQTTAALASVSHDTTLTGNGTAVSPLGVAVPFSLSSGTGSATIAGLQSGPGAGVFGTNFSNGTGVGGTSSSGYGLYGTSSTGDGVYGSTNGTSSYGVYGSAASTTGFNYGVYGVSQSTSGTGVFGLTTSGGYGVIAGNVAGGTGLYAYGPSAAHFDGNVSVNGNVSVTGTVSKGGGSFKIDDPIDPENKYLYHSFVESPDMMNIYNGNILLDGAGEAVVELPAWFQALNRDFRYQLTCIADVTPVYVKEEVQNNQFTIAGLKPGVKVSWQITGIRRDPFANAHRIPVEEEKPEAEKGRYLHPREYGQPHDKGIDSTRESKP